MIQQIVTIKGYAITLATAIVDLDMAEQLATFLDVGVFNSEKSNRKSF